MERIPVNELAKRMRVSRSTIYKWIKLGAPYYTTPSGRFRFDIIEIADWCDKTKQVGD